MSRSHIAGVALRSLVLFSVVAIGAALSASDTPPPPASPMSRLVRQLAEKRAAEKAPTEKTPTKEELFRPEFRFKPAKIWLLLPDLAKQLSTNDEERAAVFQLFDQGAREANRLLAAEGADNDVVAATALFMTQLWSFVREREIPDADTNALHAQLVAALAGPEIAKMSDAEKQKYWEYCIGFPVFVLGMKEMVSEPSALSDLRTIASAGFEALVGVKPDVVDIGPKGLVVRAGLEAAMREAPQSNEKTPGPTQSALVGSVDGITYTAPTGWTRENANWATIFRATLFDVRDNGEPAADRPARHAGSIFLMSPRALTKDVPTTFDATWREQFAAFDLGDTIVHYRSRLKCGLVIHYMGRFLHRKTDPQNALNTYAVLYLVDLGGGRVQPVTAIVVPNDPSTGMDSFKESAAARALQSPLIALLDSIKPSKGSAPYPAGGCFAPSDFVGEWMQSSSAFGGSYYNTVTGAAAGVATSVAGGHFTIRGNGTYDYAFAYSISNPQMGNSVGSAKHQGRYHLDGDVFLGEPTMDLGYKFTYCAVGIGTRQTPDGLKRILVLVDSNSQGVFRAPPLIPNWDSYAGSMTWYLEK